MAVADPVEALRLQRQVALDAAKTSAERNRLGQFATPTRLASEILAYAEQLLPPDQPVRFLDPAFGTGAFYAALLRTFPEQRIITAQGFEIDPRYGDVVSHLWQDTRLNMRIADFTRCPAPLTEDAKATLLICNPPYVRHHHLPVAEKLRLQGLVKHQLGITLSGLAGLYCSFLCLSDAWLAPGGLAGWLIPSEFMDVNYGRAVKQYLLDHVTLLRLHRFDPNDVQFGDALVSSVVVWFRKAPPPPGHTVEFSYGGTLSAPQVMKRVPAATLRTAQKWTGFPLATDTSVASGQATLADFFNIKRGVATGGNAFFILDEARTRELELPPQFLTPIIPSPRYLRDDEIHADAAGNPLLEQKLFLLTCNLPELEVEARFPALWAYLRTGVAAGVHTHYLCTHRSPWYVQETRLAPLFFCPYMGRAEQPESRPFRFILNHSNAVAANVYLLLYPRAALRAAINAQPDLVRDIWQALNTISAHTLMTEGRVYGGGLHKLEPKELANTPATAMLAVLPACYQSLTTQLSLFS